MSHFVRDWMSSPVTVVDPDSSVTYALTLMRRRNIHSLVVVLDENLKTSYGIITTTDIRDKIIAADRNPADTTIRDIMTMPVLCAHPDWTLKQCSVEMQSRNIHHMPVTDEQGTLVGLISATDLFIAAEEIGWDAGY
ncbi:MAG TPA: CBS domain-containing protein [Bellilinea sp.]|nr:CBS domain-containing protein [Bellilinea sp.]